MLTKLISRIRILWKLLPAIAQTLITYLPGDLGNSLRTSYWRPRLRHLGRDVIIDVGVYFQNPDFIELDDNCWIDRNVIILAGLDRTQRERVCKENRHFPGQPGVVHIGKNVHVGPNCILSGISAGIYVSDNSGLSAGTKLYAFSHHYRSKRTPSRQDVYFSPMVLAESQCIVEGPIFIGRNTGLALNCVTLPGTSICENSFVAINSVLHGSEFEENSLIAGDPAKRIGERYQDKEERMNTVKF